VQGGGEINVPHLLFVLLQAAGFVVLIAVAGGGIMRRSSNWLEAPINPRSPLTLSLALCLGLAAAAAYIGLAAIIGAFLAGMAVAETRQRDALEQQLKPIEALLVPFFFVVTGANVKLVELASVEALTTLAVITLLAIVSKLVGCGIGAWSMGARSALIVGVGMVPRGEVGIIIASLGKQAGVISAPLYAIIIAMSLLTSVVAPPALTALFGRGPKAAPAVDPFVPH
jgi:Kef-type K+ transport system membrane component KefB